MGLSKQVTCSGPYLATKYSKEPLVAKQGPEPRARQTSPVCVFQPLCAVRCHDPVSGVCVRGRLWLHLQRASYRFVDPSSVKAGFRLPVSTLLVRCPPPSTRIVL